MTTNLRGPAWGRKLDPERPAFSTQRLNQMERYLKHPEELRLDNAWSDDPEVLLMSYLRENVPYLIEALRR